MKAAWMALMLVLVALAGCTSDDVDPDDEPTQGEGTTGGNASDEEDDAPLPPLDEVSARFHLHAGGLSTEAPNDGKIPLESWGLFAGTASWSEVEFASQPLNTSIHIAPQQVDVTLWIQTDAAAVGNPLFDLAVWVGSSRGEFAFTFESIQILTPGEPQEVTLNMGMNDNIDHVLPEGETLTMRVIGAYEPEGAGLHNIIIGADTPSGFDLTYQPLREEVASEASVVETFTGTMEGGAFAECPRDDVVHRFTVPEDATIVNLILSGSNPATGERIDIDLDLFDGSTLLHHAGSPHAEEEILLVGPALEPYLGEELGTSSSICLGPSADYTIELYMDGTSTE